jgi:pilus assembly protein CpaF
MAFMTLSRRLGQPNEPPVKPTQPFPAETPDAPRPTRAKLATQEAPAVGVTKKRTPPHIAELRKKIRPALLSAPNEADMWERENPEHQRTISERLRVYLQRMNILVQPSDAEILRQAILDDLLGYGAIDKLIRDKSITEVMVNGPEIIFAESKGKLFETEYVFDDNDHVDWVAQRIVRRVSRSLDRAHLMTDARLPDGSRVHVIMPPSALQGTTITIRKFPERVLTVKDLINWGSMTQEVAEFLEACVAARISMVVSGGTGSGKTTLLNVLSGFIPDEERVVTIEDAAELQLSQHHVVRLETIPPIPGSKDETGRLTIRDLVRGSLRMRPDRIVVGECRGGEAIDMLQAMNTGQDGSLTTVHANSPRDCIARLETLALMGGMDLPLTVIRRQIASAVELIIQQSRLKDGSRKITQITEVQGMEGEQVVLQDLFIYKLEGQSGIEAAQVSGGRLQPSGFRPSFMDKLEHAGYKLNARIFGANTGRPAQV